MSVATLFRSSINSGLRIPALSLLLHLHHPLAESGDLDVLSSAQIILDDFKEAVNDANAVFLGDVEVTITVP